MLDINYLSFIRINSIYVIYLPLLLAMILFVQLNFFIISITIILIMIIVSLNRKYRSSLILLYTIWMVANISLNLICSNNAHSKKIDNSLLDSRKFKIHLLVILRVQIKLFINCIQMKNHTDHKYVDFYELSRILYQSILSNKNVVDRLVFLVFLAVFIKYILNILNRKCEIMVLEDYLYCMNIHTIKIPKDGSNSSFRKLTISSPFLNII